MIRKLRGRLVAASMISLGAVLAVIILLVSGFYYRRIVSYADSVLGVLEANGGRFPQTAPSGKDGLSGPGTQASSAADGSGTAASAASASSASAASASSASSASPAVPQNGKHGDASERGSTGVLSDFFAEPDLNSPELPFETRYFSVLLTTDGTAVSTDTGKIAAVDHADAAAMAQNVYASGAASGFSGNYRYVYYTDPDADNDIRVIFIDCSRDLSGFRTISLLVCSISAVAWCAVFVLVYLLSRRIVRPFSENYEKQRRFITDAGHDIKTPITVINADADVMEMESGKNEWLDDIRLQTKHLTELTNELIDLSRMEEGSPHLQLIDLPFSELVSETAASFQAPAVEQHKTLVTEIAPMLTVCGDEKTLRRLVAILLDNALKYSPENSRLSLRLTQQGRFVRLSVTNPTTYKVTQENLKNMFDRFYRADASRNSATGGYGIGLSIARAAVASHRGRITAESPDGTSMTVTCSFPAAEEKKGEQG